MLPATTTRRPSLADVLPSCLQAILGGEGSLALPRAAKAVILLVDGLGTHALAARAGHSRTLAPRVSKATTMSAGFPTTTASALATLATGTTPGIHGLVGYSVLDRANDRVVNQLSGWDERLDPATWQRSPTMFERAAAEGVASFVVATERYRESGFTRAVLRGAEYRSGSSISDRFAEARRVLDSTARALVYLYVPELDMAAHAEGVASEAWLRRLEELDSALSSFLTTLRPDEGVVVTADHGIIDVPEHGHILFDEDPALVDGIRFVAGEPRCLQLHFEPDASTPMRERTISAWRAAEGSRAWIATRTEAIDAGWFGPRVDADVVPRIGDIIVAARKTVAYYDSRAANQSGRGMVGQHGSLSPKETAIPLLRFGAFERAN